MSNEELLSKPLWKVQEVAQYLDVDKLTVYRLIANGKLPSVKMSPKLFRIRREDVLTFVNANRVMSANPFAA